MFRTTTIGAVLGATLLVPAAAGAHVTLQPKEGPAGAYVVENVRVPNEDDKNATTKVVLQFPAGFEFVSYQPVPGWDVEVAKKGDAIDTVTFSGGKIEPGQFVEFPLSLQLPEDAAGKALTFKALQTYEGGEVVRWIGAPDSDKPAPTIAVEEAEEAEEDAAGGGHGEGHTAATPTTPTAATPTADDDDDGDDDGDGLAIVALVVGGLGLLVGAAGLAAARRRSATA